MSEGSAGRERRWSRWVLWSAGVVGVSALVVLGALFWNTFIADPPARDEMLEVRELLPAEDPEERRELEDMGFELLRAQRERAEPLWRAMDAAGIKRGGWSWSWAEAERWAEGPDAEELARLLGEAVDAYHASGDWRALEAVGAVESLPIYGAGGADDWLRPGWRMGYRWAHVAELEGARAGRLFERGMTDEAVRALASALAITAAVERGAVDSGILASIRRRGDWSALQVWRDAARSESVELPTARRVVDLFAERARSRADLVRVSRVEGLAALAVLRRGRYDNQRYPGERRPLIRAGRGADYAALRSMIERLGPPEDRTARRFWVDRIAERRGEPDRLPGRFTYRARIRGHMLAEDLMIAAWRAVQLETLPIVAALEGYRLEHGEYPASLDALVPGWLGELPADPLAGDGSAFSYRRLDDPAEREEWGGPYVLWAEGDGVAGPSRSADVVVEPP